MASCLTDILNGLQCDTSVYRQQFCIRKHFIHSCCQQIPLEQMKGNTKYEATSSPTAELPIGNKNTAWAIIQLCYFVVKDPGGFSETVHSFHLHLQAPSCCLQLPGKGGVGGGLGVGVGGRVFSPWRIIVPFHRTRRTLRGKPITILA